MSSLCSYKSLFPPFCMTFGRIFLRKSAISQCIWPLSLVFTFFFFMKENRRAFSE